MQRRRAHSCYEKGVCTVVAGSLKRVYDLNLGTPIKAVIKTNRRCVE